MFFLWFHQINGKVLLFVCTLLLYSGVVLLALPHSKGGGNLNIYALAHSLLKCEAVKQTNELKQTNSRIIIVSRNAVEMGPK